VGIDGHQCRGQAGDHGGKSHELGVWLHRLNMDGRSVSPVLRGERLSTASPTARRHLNVNQFESLAPGAIGDVL
jgi:hypothetical protein